MSRARFLDFASRLVPWLAGPIAVLGLMAGVLSGRDQLAFRDVGYFYTPLYEYVAELQDAGSLDRPDSHFRGGGFGWLTGTTGPQWNPLDLTGMPLAGETTTAVHYPIRQLIFVFRWDACTAIGVYVTVHLLLASFAATWAARQLGIASMAAGVAGVVYPLSGSVLFLAVNPPYLVSAAWLPIVLVGLLGPVQPVGRKVSNWGDRRGKLAKALAGGVALAMMVLGGDPPTALHTGMVVMTSLCLAVVMSYLRLPKRRGVKRHARVRRSIRTVCEKGGRQLVWPLGSVALAIVLAAPQWAASLDWSRWSDRAGGVPRQEAFAYSIGPWRWFELSAPNLFGTPWPVNDRWDRWLLVGGRTAAVDALWTPTLYAGMVVPLSLIAAGAAMFRRCRRTSSAATGVVPQRFAGLGHRHAETGSVWLTPLITSATVWGAVAAMGCYGPLYPSLVALLPGYDAFRYPSKWLPLFSFAVAMLAALWVHRSVWAPQRIRRRPTENTGGSGGFWTRRRTVVVTILLALALLAVAWRLDYLAASSAARPKPDAWWGPLRTDSLAISFLASVSHAAFFLVVIMGWWHVWKKCPAAESQTSWRSRVRWDSWFARRAGRSAAGSAWAGVGWLLIILVDLVIAHHDLIPTVPRHQVRQLVAERRRDVSWEQQVRAGKLRRWVRVVRDSDSPSAWRRTSDPDRLVQVEAWARVSWLGRWHLADRQGVFNSLTSIRPDAVGQYWKHTLAVVDSLSDERAQMFWRRAEDWLGVAGRIRVVEDKVCLIRSVSPAEKTGAAGERIDQPTADSFFAEDWRLRSPASLADSWQELIQRWLPENSGASGGSSDRIDAGTRKRDPLLQMRRVRLGPNGGVWNCRSSSPVTLFRPVFQDGHWQAWIEPQEASARQTNSAVVWTSPIEESSRNLSVEAGRRFLTIRSAEILGQAIDLPAGNWRLIVQYRPWWWSTAAWVSASAWWVTLIVGVGMWLVRWPKPDAADETTPDETSDR